MPRIVLRVKRKLAAESPAASGGEKGPSSSPPEMKPERPASPKQPHPQEKETINCVLNTHVTHLSTDTDSENTTDSGSCDAVDLHPWVRRKRPRKKTFSPSAGAARPAAGGSKISPVRNRNLDDTNMDGSGGSPLSKYSDGVNRPILRSMVRKRSHSESLKTDSNWCTDPLAMGGFMAAPAAEMEWPKIQIELSRKEKEEDFFRIDGTKLPLRPKRRAKPVEKALQNCYPGMSLEDVTKARYEVRERKNVKKKRRGLKGMDTDSD